MAPIALNVLKQPIELFSQQPMTGFFRDGYCRTAGDPSNLAVAAIVTDEFLDFSASRGYDLSPFGVRGGCKWCISTARWLQAYEAYRRGKISNLGVPRVDLEATECSALKLVSVETFRPFAVKHEQPNAGGSGSGAA
ncbi:hypothetical protein F4776DRAFT_669066 [Hypoxylon sp. NC0597]|nr:hypothetical protein F4776DRAFT_669066 [Hypoxylon sp. NC0597]